MPGVRPASNPLCASRGSGGTNDQKKLPSNSSGARPIARPNAPLTNVSVPSGRKRQISSVWSSTMVRYCC